MRELELQLNTACQLRCLHCYAEAEPSTDCIISLEDLEKCLRAYLQIYQQTTEFPREPLNITVTGGEPFLLPDAYLAQVFQLCQKLFTPFTTKLELGLSTNLIYTSATRIQALQRLGVKVGASFDVGLRQSSQLTSEQFIERWNHCYDQMTAEFKTSLPISVTLTRALLKFNFIEWLQERQVTELSLQLLQPTGRALEHWTTYGLTLDEISDALIDFFRNRPSTLTQLSPYDAVAPAFKSKLEDGFGQSDYWNDCHLNFSISSTGQLHALGSCSAIYGNLLTDSVNTVLRSTARVAYIRQRLQLPIECSACEYRIFCRGGCLLQRTLRKTTPNSECSGLRRVLDELIDNTHRRS
jgi:radical SAM protein with 4Fe4S-binding SPASM domain